MQNNIKIQSVVTYIIRNLRNKIVQGRFKPGQKIKEIDVANNFNVSRPPIREAFKILESEGLILIKPRKGAFVAEFTLKDIWEVYTVKAALYVQAIDSAMDRITEHDFKKLESVLQNMEESVKQEPPNINKYQQFHMKLHDIIYQIAENGRLRHICRSMNNQLSRFSCLSFSNEKHLLSSLQRHKEILKAIKAGDKELAKKIIYIHAIEGLNNLKKILKQGEQ